MILIKQKIVMMMMMLMKVIIIIMIIIIIIIITVMQKEHLQDAIAPAESLGDVLLVRGLKKVKTLNGRSSLT